MMKTLINKLRIVTTIVSIFFISSCTTLTSDIDVETHSDPSINYNAYKTYAWAGSTQIVFDPIGQWEQPTLDTDEEVRSVINRELGKRGFKLVEHHPDLYVAFAAGIDTTALELEEDPESRNDALVNVPKAALMVALIDANTNYVIWLGYAMGDAQNQQSIEDIRTRIDYAVSEIFRSYNR